MKDLVNFVPEHELVERDYGSHIKRNEVKNISFHSCIVYYNFKK